MLLLAAAGSLATSLRSRARDSARRVNQLAELLGGISMPLRGSIAHRTLVVAFLSVCATAASALPPLLWRATTKSDAAVEPVSFEQLVDRQSPSPSGEAAKLVRNPASEAGAPPFALEDPAGRVVRLVEPTPGVALADFVGQKVRIRHDTGRTLLASQLDLPISATQPLRVAQLPTADSDKSVLKNSNGTNGVEPLPEPNVPEPIVLEEIAPELGAGEILPLPSNSQSVEPSELQFPSLLAPTESCPHCQAEGALAPAPRPAVRGGAAKPCARCRSGRVHSPLNCPTCSRGNAGLDFSADLLFLRAHETTAADSGSGYDTATRWEIGYSGAWRQRLGLRYFEYGTNTRLGGLIDVETLDLEYQQSYPLGCCGEWSLSGGLRWTEYDERTNNFAFGYSNSIGPLLGLSLRTPATRWADGFVNLRQSWQFGEPYRRGASVGRGTFSISELQVGLEHRRKMQIGDGFVRGTFETQYWNGIHTGGTGDLGLVGFGIGVGLQR